MTLCLGKLGKWCIYATYPVYTPKKIRYRYPGGDWVEVEGESYTITPNPPTLGQVPGKAYWVTVATENYFTGGTEIIPNVYAVGPIQGLMYTPRFEGFGPSYWVTIQDANPPVFRRWYDAQKSQDPVNSSRFLSGLWGINWRITDIQPFPGFPPDPPDGSCTFKVFGSSGQVLLDQTTSECPEVMEIPESCTFPNPEVFVREYLNSNISSYAIIVPDPNDPNCVFINVAIPSDPVIETPPFVNIAYLCGDCLPPQIRIDCECDPCFDKKCPAGTVNRILIGNSIECVDGNDCVIAVIPYDPNCETPNCFC